MRRLALLLLLVTGCAAGTQTVTVTTTQTVTTVAQPQPDFTTGLVERSNNSNSPALLEDLRVAGHDGYDRVVLEFENVPPSYRIEYAAEPFVEDGSGREVEVAGAAWLRITMVGASGFDASVDEGRVVYEGPSELLANDTAVVREVERTSDYEGVMSWVVGLTERVAYRAFTLQSPPRLVVDFRAP